MEEASTVEKGNAKPAVLPWSDEQKDLIKRQCAKGSTSDEFLMFLHFCRTSGVDPLRGQAHFIVREWVDKRTSQKRRETTMMVGIDGMRSRAEQHDDYLGITSAAVRDGDTFEVDFGAGAVTHKAKFPRSGKVLGAWSKVLRKDRAPSVVWVDMAEYFQEYNPIWKEKPEIMITKVAEATNLRHEFPEPFSRVYEPAEFGTQITDAGTIQEIPEDTKQSQTQTPEITPAKGLSQWASKNGYAWPHVANKVTAMGYELVSLTQDQANAVAKGLKAAHPEGDAGPKAQCATEGAEPAPEPQNDESAPPDPDYPEKPSYIVLAETWEDSLAEGADIGDLHDALLAAEGLTDEERKQAAKNFAAAVTTVKKRRLITDLANRVLAVG